MKLFILFQIINSLINFDSTQWKIKNYSMKDGLNSNTVYSLTRDDIGRYWFVTPGGLMSFDGYEFKSYNSSHGLKNKDLLSVSYFKNHLYTTSINNLEIIPLKDIENNKDNKLYPYSLVKSFGSFQYGDIYSILFIDSVIEFIGTRKINSCKVNYPYYDFKTRTYKSLSEKNKILDKCLIQPAFYLNTKWEYLYANKIEGIGFMCEIDNNGKLNKKFQYMYNKNFVEKFDIIKHDIYLSNYNNIISILYKDKKWIKKSIIQNISVNNFIEEKGIGFWLTTPNNGLYLYSLKKYLTLNQTTFKYKNVNRKFILYENNENLFKYKLSENKIDFIYVKTKFNLNKVGMGIKSFSSYSDSEILIGYRDRTLLTNIYTKKYDSLDNSWVKKLRVDDKKNIYILTYNDFRIIKNKEKKIYKFLYRGNYTLINDIRRFNNTYYFGSNDQGLFISDTQFKNIKQVSTKNSLQSDLINQVKLDKYNRIWLQTEKGIDRVSTDLNVTNILQFGELDDYNIKDFAVSDDSVWVFTDEKVYSLNYNERLKPQAIPIILNSCIIDDSIKYYKNDSIISIGPKWNSLKINFAGIHVEDQENINYRYRIVKNGDTGAWQLTNQHILSLTSLEAASYQIQIQAFHKTYPNIQSKLLNLNFCIKPFFYQTWWFYTLVFGFLLSILLAFIWYRNKLKLDKLRAESELNRLTLHGLQNQMNPHFVFNALNTLQHFILKTNQLKALNYLSDFSSLIRKILNNSRSELITLEEDIEFLREYTAIEVERYSHQFKVNFILKFDEDELSDIKIPPMLIQPLVENAIKHGVSNLEKNGEINIEFDLIEDDLLQISVIDNGLGIIDTGKTSSKATLILHERLALIQNKHQKGSFELKRIDNFTYAILQIPI